MSILELAGISAGYGKYEALSGITFKVKPGEIISVIGPNGSGKTTLLKVITKYLNPWDGSVLYGPDDIQSLDAGTLAKKIAVVSQEQDIQQIKIVDYVLLGRMPYFKKWQFFETEEDVAAAIKYMELTDISRHGEKMLSDISGGERQLAHIARALVQEPELLLLDEPTAYLDITHQVGILNLIKKLNKELGLTVIMVLHDLNLAAEYADRLILLDRGSIFKDGFPRDVLTYQNIEAVYKTPVIVNENPVSKRPYVVAVSERMKEKNNREFSD